MKEYILLKTAREDTGLSQEAFGEILGLAQKPWSNRETGFTSINLAEACLIRDVLNKHLPDYRVEVDRAVFEVKAKPSPDEIFYRQAMKTNITPSAAPAQPGALEAAS